MARPSQHSLCHQSTERREGKMKPFRSVLVLLFLFCAFKAMADDTFQTARYIGATTLRTLSVNGNVNANDVNDYMAFQVTTPGNYLLTLGNMTANASLGIYDHTNKILGLSTNPGNQQETIRVSLSPGRYVVRVASWQLINNTNYTLSITNQSIVVRPTPIPRPAPTPAPPQIGKIVIRGIPYNNHSNYTTMSTNRVLLGDYFNINSRTLNFNPGTVKVVLQEVNRGGGFGHTVYELRGINRYGNSLQVQAPWLQLFKGRTFYVSVFQYTGAQNNYAQAGQITFQ